MDGFEAEPLLQIVHKFSILEYGYNIQYPLNGFVPHEKAKPGCWLR